MGCAKSIGEGLDGWVGGFGSDTDVAAGVVTFVGKEGGHPCRGILGVVVDKLCKGEQLIPIVLLIIAVDSEVLF
jgi:hypothetical protein